ncbi:uncharacterized protein LOC110367074 [Fundulus heteroclitus]|uniref:uncharacterized protein LOC110367074 n=1 Tax=Fundulus heteroclitus TaxID=8078 RepID=UPI00165B9ACB|nr:uncharacterized protein LOC110367074 [Fundulus heteroclitus]
MAKLLGAPLLLIVLVDCVFSMTAYHDEFHSAGFTRTEIRKCRCQVTQSGRIKCPFPLIPTNQSEKLSLQRCLCCTRNPKKNRTTKTNAFCRFQCFSQTPL